MSAHGSRPDQRLGVFETLLVREGRPLELDAHLERLRSSLATVYDARLPPGTELLVLDGARELALGRLRLAVAPNGNGVLGATVRAAEIDRAVMFPTLPDGVSLTELVVPGGLGDHKWADRRTVAPLETGDSIPLIVDDDGTVLEASRANVFIVESGTIVTPPADARLLPGVTRRRVIELVPVREDHVSRDRLLAADEVFLSGSVRGIEPVRDIDGARHWTEAPLTAVVADHLRRRWEDEP